MTTQASDEEKGGKMMGGRGRRIRLGETHKQKRLRCHGRCMGHIGTNGFQGRRGVTGDNESQQIVRRTLDGGDATGYKHLPKF